MKLWTFQSIKAIEALQKNGVLYADWQYCPDLTWERAYRWMAAEMNKRDIPIGEHPPIWAWHSCKAYGHPPTLGDARALLSDIELEHGVQTLELSVPDELVLLSTYHLWNDLLDYFIDKKPLPKKQGFEKMFEFSNVDFERTDAIQATLPFLKKEWIVDIRDLNLKVGDYEVYDVEEEV